MKTTTARALRNSFPSVLRHVEAGEAVAITRRGKVVATLTPPPKPQPPRKAWADVEQRLATLFPQPLGVSMADLISEDRDR